MQTFCTLISFFCRDRIFSTLISFYNHYVTLVYLDIILLPRCDIFYLDFILLLPCTIFYRDTILLPWWNIFYLDIILLPYCDFSHLDIILLPWSHFTTVMEHFVHWYQFGPKILGGGGGRRPPEPLPLIRHCLFYCHDVTFCTLISSRVPRDGTLSTLIMISRPWCTRPFGCFAEHFYTVFVRPWSEFVFIVRRCLVFFISRLSTSRMKIKVLTASAGAWGKGTGKIGSLVLVLRARYCSVCSSIFEKTKEKKSLCTDYAVPFSKKSF